MFINIPKYFINNLIYNIKIENIIGRCIKLEKKDKNYIGICPFHKEKTPSFFVYSKEKRYYCYGCLSTGNIIKFIMLYKNINFISSVKYLSEISGITMLNMKYKSQINFHYYNFMSEITNFYKKNFDDNIKIKKNLYKYISNRNLSLETLDFFDIGFASNTGCLRNFVNGLKFKSKLLDYGLIIDNGLRVYDRFINRIIFPIKNQSGNIIGFGGRSIVDKYKPKYINSPESTYFKKKNELYGLFECKEK